MPTPDIFLSYNREDASRAKQFADALEAEGFCVWWDATLRSGETYDVVTETALDEARAVVVLWSPNSVNSRWVRAEATEADRARKLVPAMIAPCKRPIMFELTQTAELSHWKGERSDKAWQAFVSDLRRHTGVGAATTTSSTLPASGSEEDKKNPRSTMRMTLVIFAVLAVGALAFALYLLPFSGTAKLTSHPVQVASFTAEGGPAATLLASSLKNTTQEVLGDAGFRSRLVGQPSGNDGVAIKGTVITNSGKVTAFIQIEHMPTGETVWSGQFEDVEAKAEAVAVAAAVAAVESLNTLRDAERQDGLRLDPDDIADFIEGGNAVSVFTPNSEGKAFEIFQRLAARLPNSAHAHAMFALTLRDSPERRSAEIAKAISLDPRAAGAAFDARFSDARAVSPRELVKQEDLLLDGLRQAPEFAFLSMRECDFLSGMGRIAEARKYCVKAIAMRPTSSPIAWRMSRVESLGGDPGLAAKAIERALRYYPDAFTARVQDFRVKAFGDEPEQALERLARLQDISADLGQREIAALRAFVRARVSGAAGDKAEAVAGLLDAARDGGLPYDLAIPSLVVLGEVDQAFVLLGSSVVLNQRTFTGSSFLFGPELAPLRADPRFWQLAAREGLVDYWLKREVWPDFCGKEVSLTQCKALAAASTARK